MYKNFFQGSDLDVGSSFGEFPGDASMGLRVFDEFGVTVSC